MRSTVVDGGVTSTRAGLRSSEATSSAIEDGIVAENSKV